MKNSFWLMICMIFLSNSSLIAKVRILTFHYNKPEFIELQYLAFKKFSRDDFEMIVFNDASNMIHEKNIKNMCDRYQIKCVRFEQAWHKNDPLNNYVRECLNNPSCYSHLNFGDDVSAQASVRHCHVIQYALDHYGYKHDDAVVILDGDCFPIRELSIRDWLQSSDITAIQKLISEDNIDYLWVVFIAFNPSRLPDLDQLKFHVDVINNKLHDSGAHSYYYLQDHPNLKVRKYLSDRSTGFCHWKDSQIKSFGFTDHEMWLIRSLPWPQSVRFDMNKHFMHFGDSSFELEGALTKQEYVTQFMHKILQD